MVGPGVAAGFLRRKGERGAEDITMALGIMIYLVHVRDISVVPEPSFTRAPSHRSWCASSFPAEIVGSKIVWDWWLVKNGVS